MRNWKKLIGSCALVIFSSGVLGCQLFQKPVVPPPDIIMIGDCEHGIVTTANLEETLKIFPEAQRTDVLMAGGCYQEHVIKAK